MGVETMAIAALALTAVSTGMGVMGQMAQGRSAKEWSDYNASVMEQEAEVVRQKTEMEANQARRQGRRIMGSQRAALAKAGVELSSGSPLELLEETAVETDLAVRGIRWAGDMEAHRAMSAAEAERFKGKAAQRASYWGAGSTFLSGASRMASMGYNYRQNYGGGGGIKEETLTR